MLPPAAARLADAAAAYSSIHGRVRLVEAIEAEPALTLAVLACSGAPSVPRAVDATPASTLVAIARSAHTIDPLSSADPSLALLRLHSLAVRSVAERVASLAGEDVDVAIAAALVHDLGKLALGDGGPGAALAGGPEERVARERELHGTDHARIGAAAMRSLGVHPHICERVEHHHGDHDAGVTLRLADALCHYGHGHPVEIRQLIALSARAGMSRDQLGELLYDLAAPVSRATRPLAPNPLSGRECEVMRALAEGKPVKEIALQLGLSASTVRNHLHRIYGRIGASDRSQAVLIAKTLNWL
jgi:putative nucleotidyltransferase with HDIG domain